MHERVARAFDHQVCGTASAKRLQRVISSNFCIICRWEFVNAEVRAVGEWFGGEVCIGLITLPAIAGWGCIGSPEVGSTARSML